MALKWIVSAENDGDSRAVIVPADAAILQTGQLYPAGDILEADRQAVSVLDELDHTLAAARCDPAEVVRVHLYAATAEAAAAAVRAVGAHYPAGRRPAVTCVVGALARDKALVALDATAVASEETPGKTAGLLPAGRAKLYISGQAEKSADVREAARKTLESLKKTLTFLESGPECVVQAKCFITPMSGAEGVGEEVRAALGEEVPVTLVEWKSSETTPVEIELVAHAAAREGAPAVEFLTPPGMVASPLFARVTRVSGAAATVYTASLQGPEGGDGTGQVTAIYEGLKELLGKCGSDLGHLAKATYYPTTEDASKALNAVRPNYYDPKRPPAASKAMVPGVYPARGISVDVIAAVRP